MHLAVVPDGLLERLAMLTGFVPTPFVLTFWGMGASRAILTGVELGVFEALASGPQTAEQVAQTLKTDPWGTSTLLNALNGFGLLHQEAGHFRLRRQAERWMSPQSPHSLQDAFLFATEFEKLLHNMTERVRTGQRYNMHLEPQTPEFWRRYMRGLASYARVLGKELARRTVLPSGSKRLLDVGGGHGMFSAAFCRRNPGLRAEVLDLPEVQSTAFELLTAEGMADRVVHRAGDLRSADWGTDYDVVLLFNVLHTLSAEEAEAAIRTARTALRPGGMLIVLDAEHEHGTGDVSPIAGFAELFFYTISASQAWPEATLRAWMKQAAFGDIRRKRMFAIPLTILTGRA